MTKAFVSTDIHELEMVTQIWDILRSEIIAKFNLKFRGQSKYTVLGESMEREFQSEPIHVKSYVFILSFVEMIASDWLKLLNFVTKLEISNFKVTTTDDTEEPDDG